MSINRPSRLVIVTMSADYGTGYRGTHEYDDLSKMYTKKLAEELLQLTSEKTHVLMYPEGHKVPWLTEILTDRLKPKVSICENVLSLENNECSSLSLIIRYILNNQEIREESYVLVIIAYYPKYDSPPEYIDLEKYNWLAVKGHNGRNMNWVEYIELSHKTT